MLKCNNTSLIEARRLFSRIPREYYMVNWPECGAGECTWTTKFEISSHLRARAGGRRKQPASILGVFLL
jgi:hypothetical protein